MCARAKSFFFFLPKAQRVDCILLAQTRDHVRLLGIASHAYMNLSQSSLQRMALARYSTNDGSRVEASGCKAYVFDPPQVTFAKPASNQGLLRAYTSIRCLVAARTVLLRISSV